MTTCVCPTVTGFPKWRNYLQGHTFIDLVKLVNYRRDNLLLLAFGKTAPCPTTTQALYVNLCHTWQNVHLPPFTLCCLVTPKDDQITTLCTVWTTLSVTIARNSYAYAHFHLHMPTVPKSEADILNVLKLCQGNQCFANVSHGHI